MPPARTETGPHPWSPSLSMDRSISVPFHSQSSREGLGLRPSSVVEAAPHRGGWAARAAVPGARLARPSVGHQRAGYGPPAPRPRLARATQAPELNGRGPRPRAPEAPATPATWSTWWRPDLPDLVVPDLVPDPTRCSARSLGAGRVGLSRLLRRVACVSELAFRAEAPRGVKFSA